MKFITIFSKDEKNLIKLERQQMKRFIHEQSQGLVKDKMTAVLEEAKAEGISPKAKSFSTELPESVSLG